MLREAAEMGFEYVELSHGTRISLIPGILEALREGVIKVASVHNFCPLPVGIMGPAPNLFEPTANDRTEHQQWFQHTRKSIAFAREVGARVVVVHGGRVGFWWNDPETTIERFVHHWQGEGKILDDPDYQQLVAKTRLRLQKKAVGAMERLAESLRMVAEEAAEAGLILGIENREGVTEMPLDDGFPALMHALEECPSVGTWHDTGHAHLKQQMGLASHARLLEETAPRLCGFHLHDVSPEGRDHQVPGTGEVNWDLIKQHLRKDHLTVLELSPKLTREEVLLSKEYVVRKLGLT